MLPASTGTACTPRSASRLGTTSSRRSVSVVHIHPLGTISQSPGGDCVHASNVPGPPKPPVPPRLSSLPLLIGCIRFANTEMHLSAKWGIFSTQVLRPEAENLFGNLIRFSGAGGGSRGSGSYLAGCFAVWRESQKPLLAWRKASRRPNGPARESCRPGPMSVTLQPARSDPPARIGVRLEHDRRGSRSGPAEAWGDPRRTRPHRPSRRPGGRPAPNREPPVRPELLHADPARWAQHLSTPRDAG